MQFVPASAATLLYSARAHTRRRMAAYPYPPLATQTRARAHTSIPLNHNAAHPGTLEHALQCRRWRQAVRVAESSQATGAFFSRPSRRRRGGIKDDWGLTRRAMHNGKCKGGERSRNVPIDNVGGTEYENTEEGQHAFVPHGQLERTRSGGAPVVP